MKSYLLLCLMQRAGVPIDNPVWLWPTTGNHPTPAPQAEPEPDSFCELDPLLDWPNVGDCEIADQYGYVFFDAAPAQLDLTF